MDTEEVRRDLVMRLRALGIAQLVISYSGSGDSGQIDEIAAYRKGDDPDAGDAHTKALDVDDLWNGLGPEQIAIMVSNKLMNIKNELLSVQLEQLGYDLLNHVNAADWQNNDGGQGRITIFVEEQGEENEPGRIEIAHEYNMVTVHSESYSL
jgi:hypothetical protein